MGIGMIVGIVFVEQGQRRIPVQFAKRVVGRRMYGGQSTYIPLKVNQSGVIPIIFASRCCTSRCCSATSSRGSASALRGSTTTSSIPPTSGTSLSYGVLIVAFAYFYTAIVFDPHQQADVIRKQGGYIPGIRPGPPTERYLQQVLNRITLPGSLFLMVIAVIPLLVFAAWDIAAIPRSEAPPSSSRSVSPWRR